MPPPRKTRGSISNPSPLDDISSLTLPEVRDRLVRNERVLGLNLFSSPPPASAISSSNASPVAGGSSNVQTQPRPTVPTGNATQSPTSPENGAAPMAIAGPSRHPPAWNGTSSPPLAGSPTDPVRDRLLVVREQLLARERELVLAETQHLSLDDPKPGDVRRSSPTNGRGALMMPPGAATSGKRRAMETMQAAEATQRHNGHFLPLAQTKALAERDFQLAAAADFGALTLTASSSPKPRRRRDIYPDRPPPPPAPKWHPDDEVARAEHMARLNAFMGYRGGEDEDDEEVEVDGMFDFDPQEGQYAGDQDRLEIPGPGRGIRERGTGEAVDEFGEDEEEWAERNDEYAGNGYGSLGAGPDHD